jgi:ABC-type Fe3+/spermidine/putrescine transport system ATPase subunit/ABC-type sulfate transport system permease component
VRRGAFAILPCLAALLTVYLAAPFLAGIAHLGMADWRGADWRGLGAASLVSFLSASAATLLIALGGIPLGYLLARRQGRWMALLGFCVQLPLALPPLSSGILLLFLLGYASPLGALTHGALTDSFLGIVLAETFVAAPFLIIAARSAFAAVDPVLEDVARTLGHPPASVFLRASLPLAWRGIAAGMLLSWLRAFGEFGATVMVAYHPYSLPVYTYVAFGAEGLPAMVPVLLPTLGTALLVMLAATRLTTPRRDPKPLDAGEDTRLAPAAVPAVRPHPQPLVFTVERSLAGFSLSLSHHTQARRLAILGASGSGKSLTLRAIAGLDAGFGDRLMLGGADLSPLPPEARHIAYVPQSYGLFPHLSVWRQLAFARDHDPDAARLWFAHLGLTGLEGRRPGQLSLGQQQRVAIARALSRRSGLLLLDEPFSALDAPLRRELRASLRQLQEETEASTILVTHDPEEAFLLADEILVLERGRLLQAGPVNTVFARPRNAAVARLLGAGIASRGRAVTADRMEIGQGVTIAVAGPPLTPGQSLGWSIAPEQPRLVESGGIGADILSVDPPMAGRQTLSVRIGDAVLPVVQAPDPGLRPGPARIALPATALQIWEEDAT